MVANSVSPPLEPSSPIDGGTRKRVCKACDRCRLKKSKCDGSSPCSRCKADNAICFFGERKKSQDKVYPKGYVEMLEAQQAQLVSGLQELYQRIISGQGWTGRPLSESPNGLILTHDILERLGVLTQEGSSLPAGFEENLDVLQKKLIASGAGFLQREMSLDGGSDAGRQSFDESFRRPSPFTNVDPFQASHFPPTPPQQQSPHTTTARTSSPSKTYFDTDTSVQQFTPLWIPEFDNTGFVSAYDPPVDMAMNVRQLPFQLPQAQGSIPPCLTMKEWDPQCFGQNMVM